MDTKLLGLILQGDKKNEREFNRIKETYEELSKSKANTITSSSNGESIILSDSSDSKLDSLRVMGKTEQFTTTGKNLFNPVNVRQGYFMADSFAISDDTRTTYVFCECEPDTYYTVTKTIGARFAIACSTTDPYPGDLIAYLVSDTSKESLRVLTTSDAAYLIAYVHHTAYDTISLEEMLASIQIEKGTTPTSYEPYTGGIPSPNPQYPQELVSAGDDGDVEVGVYGANLFDASSIIVNTNVSVVTEDSGYTITAVGGSTSKYAKSRVRMAVDNLLGKTVYLTTDSITGSDGKYHLAQLEITSKSGMRLYYSVAANRLNVQFKIPEDTATLYMDIYTNNTNSPLESDVTTIIKGLRLTLTPNAAWTPYHKQPLTIPTPNGLPGIKVTDPSIATYTDEAGQMWCADEVDFERGVYVKRVYKGVAPTSGWSLNTANDSYSEFMVSATLPSFATSSVNTMSTHFMANDNNRLRYASAYGFFYARIPIELGVNTIEKANTMFAEGVTFMAILATPIETPLSESELEAYKALHTNYPTTTILNDSGAHMEVKYTADKKNYIDNKFAQITNAVLSMGSNI